MIKQTRFLKRTVVVLSVVLVMLMSVAGTLAYLQDKTDPVVNTFTSSDVSITLTETKPENNTAKMVPGADIAKDPTVTVTDDSEDCYVFVKIEKSDNFDTYMKYEVGGGWNELTTDSGIYYRVVKNSDSIRSFSVLKGDVVTVLPSVTKTMMEQAQTNTPKLTFTAYAIQFSYLADQDTDGVVDATDAWKLINSSG